MLLSGLGEEVYDVAQLLLVCCLESFPKSAVLWANPALAELQKIIMTSVTSMMRPIKLHEKARDLTSLMYDPGDASSCS